MSLNNNLFLGLVTGENSLRHSRVSPNFTLRLGNTRQAQVRYENVSFRFQSMGSSLKTALDIITRNSLRLWRKQGTKTLWNVDTSFFIWNIPETSSIYLSHICSSWNFIASYEVMSHQRSIVRSYPCFLRSIRRYLGEWW